MRKLQFTHGTSVAALRTNQGVFVAADSKTVQTHNRRQPLLECKIHREGDVFFAIAGHKRELTTGWDATPLARTACRHQGSVASKVIRFEAIVEQPLRSMLADVLRLEPEYCQKYIVDRLVLQLAFFGLEDASPYLYVRSYKVTSSLAGLDVTLENRTDAVGPDNKIALLGEYDAIDQFIASNPRYYELPPALLVERLVQVEIDAVPHLVGPPIDVVQVTRDGVQWIRRKPECDDAGIKRQLNSS
jgi:hypothetical protein